MINLSPEQARAKLLEYNIRKGAIEEANAVLDKMRADQKAKQEAFWAKVNTPHIHKVRVAQKCCCCNASLPVGSMVQTKTELVNVAGSGWTGGFRTKTLCLICSGSITKKVEL
jgi:hypothetical protein